jgi:hypothetical protein
MLATAADRSARLHQLRAPIHFSVQFIVALCLFVALARPPVTGRGAALCASSVWRWEGVVPARRRW